MGKGKEKKGQETHPIALFQLLSYAYCFHECRGRLVREYSLYSCCIFTEEGREEEKGREI